MMSTERKKKKSSKKAKKVHNDKILEFDFEELRPIAQKQINILFKKLNNKRRPKLYRREINKVILHERSM